MLTGCQKYTRAFEESYNIFFILSKRILEDRFCQKSSGMFDECLKCFKVKHFLDINFPGVFPSVLFKGPMYF